MKRSWSPMLTQLVLLVSLLCSAVLPSFGQRIITPSPTPTATPASVTRGTPAPNTLNQTPVTIRDNVDLSLVCPAQALYNLVIDSTGGIHCTRNTVLSDGRLAPGPETLTVTMDSQGTLNTSALTQIFTRLMMSAGMTFKAAVDFLSAGPSNFTFTAPDGTVYMGTDAFVKFLENFTIAPGSDVASVYQVSKFQIQMGPANKTFATGFCTMTVIISPSPGVIIRLADTVWQKMPENQSSGNTVWKLVSVSGVSVDGLIPSVTTGPA